MDGGSAPTGVGSGGQLGAAEPSLWVCFLSIAGCKVQQINRKHGLKVTVPSGAVLGFWQGILWDGWTSVSWIWRGQLLRSIFLGRLSAGINAARATCSREMFPGLLTWRWTEKFEEKPP